MKEKLTEIVNIQYGYAFDSSKFTDEPTYPPLVRIRDVKRGFTETFYSGDVPKGYDLKINDLLVGMDGEFNISRWKMSNGLLNQRVCKITAKDNVDEEFIRFYLSKELKRIEDRTDAVTVKHLSAKELNKMVLEIPNYQTQCKISKILSSIEKIIDDKNKELKLLDELVKARFIGQEVAA